MHGSPTKNTAYSRRGTLTRIFCNITFSVNELLACCQFGTPITFCSAMPSIQFARKHFLCDLVRSWKLCHTKRSIQTRCHGRFRLPSKKKIHAGKIRAITRAHNRNYFLRWPGKSQPEGSRSRYKGRCYSSRNGNRWLAVSLAIS